MSSHKISRVEIHVKIERDIRDKFKARTALDGKSMNEVIVAMIVDYLDNKKSQ